MGMLVRAKSQLRDLRRRFGDPKKYVKTDETSGQLQFELLRREGCLPTSKVLELGCGCLHLAVPLLKYLEASNYVGLDPNQWLRKKAMRNPGVQQLTQEKRARFSNADDFDARRFGEKFDFVFSHSVLSHAAHWQLEQYIRHAACVLSRYGKILSSIRLAEGNEYGSTGTPNRRDSVHTEWQYPGVTWFRLATIEDFAADCGLKARLVPEHTAFYTVTRPGEYHDWIVLERA